MFVGVRIQPQLGLLLASPATLLLGWRLPGKWAPSVLYLWRLTLELPQCTGGNSPSSLRPAGDPARAEQGLPSQLLVSFSYLRFYLQ